MPAWATVALTLGAAVVGGLIAIAGTLLQTRNSDAQERRRVEAERRERAGKVLGRVVTLLNDIEPIRIAANINNQSSDMFPNLQWRWG